MLEVTVYIPETQYGLVSLGQKTILRVDSFPGEIFTAIVMCIADMGEFTPYNIQTKEGPDHGLYD